MKNLKILPLLLLITALATSSQAQVAIIVNANNPVSDVSVADLQQYFKADKKHWPAGGAVKLAVLSLSGPAGQVVLKKIYQMDAGAYKKYWLKKVFKGDAKAPATKNSPQEVLDFVASDPGALSFVPADKVTGNVKVLKVNGKKPGEAGYPF